MSGRSGTAGRCSGGPALPAGGRSIPPGWASTTRGPHRHLGEAAPTGSRLASRAGRAESVPGWWREAEALRSAVRPQPRRQYPGSELRYLDEAPLRDAAQAHPGPFVPHDGLPVIDEVQRVPDLFLAIKHEVDIDPRPGRFLLTRAVRLVGLRDMPDLLPGRSETVELSPLSQGEIDQRPDSLIDAGFQDGAEVRGPPS